MRAGLMPYFEARWDVRCPIAMSFITRRSRSVRVPSQAGKSSRNWTWSGTGERVLSARASASGFSESVEKSGSLPTQNPCRCSARSLSTSFAFRLTAEAATAANRLGRKARQRADEAFRVLPLCHQSRKPFPRQADCLGNCVRSFDATRNVPMVNPRMGAKARQDRQEVGLELSEMPIAFTGKSRMVHRSETSRDGVAPRRGQLGETECPGDRRLG